MAGRVLSNSSLVLAPAVVALTVLAVQFISASRAEAATYYVRASGGNDGNDGLSFANGLATLQVAFDKLNADDTLYICGDFTVSAVVDVDMNAGVNTAPSITSPIRVYGANSSGTAYNGSGQATITTTTNALTSLFNLSTYTYFHWYDLKWDGGGSGKATSGLVGGSGGTGGSQYFRNCRFTNCSTNGFYVAGATWFFTKCRFDNNGKGGSGSGYATSASPRGAIWATSCVFDHNATHGCYTQGGYTLHGCLSYRNGSDGVQTTLAGQNTAINCGFYLNGSDGVESTSASSLMMLINCSAVSNSAYGFKFGALDLDRLTLLQSCLTYNNTTAATDVNSGVLPGFGHSTSNPVFVSTTDNSENFTPGASSALTGAGIPGAFLAGGTDYTDIGPIQGAHPALPSETQVIQAATNWGYSWNLLNGAFQVPLESVVKTGEGYGYENGLVGTYTGGSGGGVSRARSFGGY